MRSLFLVFMLMAASVSDARVLMLVKRGASAAIEGVLSFAGFSVTGSNTTAGGALNASSVCTYQGGNVKFCSARFLLYSDAAGTILLQDSGVIDPGATATSHVYQFTGLGHNILYYTKAQIMSPAGQVITYPTLNATRTPR